MNRRYKTELTDRHLNYELDYDSIIVVNEEENRNVTPQALFSLQFYQKPQNTHQRPLQKTYTRLRPTQRITLSSLKKAQAIYSPSNEKPQRIHATPANFRIKPTLKLNLNASSKQSLHTPSTRIQESQHPSGIQTPLDFRLTFSKISQYLFSSKHKHKNGQIDFTRFKKSIY